MRALVTFLATLTLLGAIAGLSLAQSPDRAASSAGTHSLLPSPQTTEHAIQIGERSLRYQARAGSLSLLARDGAVTADIFYVAYTLRSEKVESAPERPITFVFNGGPGAASAYLHLGALGPRILQTAPDGSFLPSPQRLLDNPDTWLNMTDLVFVDPVGTGYSREAPGQQAQSFWGVDQDATSMGAFIRLYLAESNRTLAPVYLAGESYGGFRAALLSRTLQEEVGISPSGIILISPALEFMLVKPDQFDPLHWALELPSLAAVRLQRNGVREPELSSRLKDVESYALGGYLDAIVKGLEQGEQTASKHVAELIGLPLDLIQRNFARISTRLFAREFARTRGKVLSFYDGTIETADIAPESQRNETPDPVLDRSRAVLTSAFTSYVRNELGYFTKMSYRVLNNDVSQSWDYGIGPSRQGYAGVMDDLQQARSLNPDMGVLIINGYTDLVTPYMTSRYLVSQLPFLSGARPIVLEVFEGGHMMYLRHGSRQSLKGAVLKLIQSG